MRQIKFRRIHKHYKTGEIHITYWGFLDEERRTFTGPSSIGGFEVIADEQFVGKHDLFNQDAYEGDLFLDQDTTEWIISFSEATSCFHAGMRGREHQKSMILGSAEIIKIIGNIHVMKLKE